MADKIFEKMARKRSRMRALAECSWALAELVDGQFITDAKAFEILRDIMDYRTTKDKE